MPNTYVALATHTVTGSNLSGLTGVTFTGISSAYTDLRIVQNVTLTAAAIGFIQVGNSSIDTAANYSRTTLSGDGSSASSSRTSSANQISTQIAHETTTIGTYTADFMNYSNTTTNKTVLIRNNNTAFGTEAAVGLWRSNTAITTVKLFLDRAEFYVVGSTFSLYGIANADQGAAKATGGIITEDSQYWYHTFGASGAFIPKQSLTCDVLVVAGGGGGGASGAGAGGLLLHSLQSLANGTNYSCTVGAGGTGNTGASTNSTNGVNSQFAALTASVGGGYGGRTVSNSGNSGGSGGGAFSNSGTVVSGSSPTSGQGNSGGSSANDRGGGGGGAGAAGGNGSAGGAGTGGIGSSTYSSWGLATNTGHNVSSTYYYAGGGGSFNGTSGGSGGGGQGVSSGTGGAAIANTGGGGGGGDNFAGGNGGSGIVIVRYAK